MTTFFFSFRAAGTFQYIHENFTNAPSMDLGPETLQMMVQLMCGQVRSSSFLLYEYKNTRK